MTPDSAPPPILHQPTQAEAYRFWLKLGFISFGGPSGQIALMHREIVEKRRWMEESHFLHALNFCMLLPGPEAQQLATYIGWVLHKTPGALVAGTLFFLPAAVLLWLLSWSYVVYGQAAWMTGILDGLKPAVLALVLSALIRVGRKSLVTPGHWIIAALTWVGLSAFQVPYPWLIASAAVLGWIAREHLQSRPAHASTPPSASSPPPVPNPSPAPPQRSLVPPWPTTLRRAALGLALWWCPVLIALLVFGSDHVLFKMGMFFSQASMVTFGGAYAVLPYVAQQAVEVHQWVTPTQIMDGLGLAETTPGPLIMVLQFVGFLGGWHHAQPLSPLVGATLASLMTTWCTFAPSLLMILLGAPFVEVLRQKPKLQGALSAVTAAVVGVILHLALWFGLHVLIPEGRSINLFGLLLCVTALVLLTRTSLGMIPVILMAGAIGWLRSVFLSA